MIGLPAQRAESLRRRAGLLVLEAGFRGLARLGKLHPRANPSRHGVEVLRDLPYLPTGAAAHKLDVYRPETIGPRAQPVVLYIHGGGFRILSKETHWAMGLLFARRGFVVFNVNYRLAPAARFPAAIEDVCAAYLWALENAERFGGDASRI